MRDLVLRGATVIAVVHDIQVCYEMKSMLQVYSHLAIVQVKLRFPLKGKKHFNTMVKPDSNSGEEHIAKYFATTAQGA